MKKFNFNKKTIFLINIFEIISLGISFLGVLLSFIFLNFFISFDLYYISIILFRSGLLAGVFSFICPIVLSNIKEGSF